jgi:hypothetical protein
MADQLPRVRSGLVQSGAWIDLSWSVGQPVVKVYLVLYFSCYIRAVSSIKIR